MSIPVEAVSPSDICYVNLGSQLPLQSTNTTNLVQTPFDIFKNQVHPGQAQRGHRVGAGTDVSVAMGVPRAYGCGTSVVFTVSFCFLK